MYYKVEIFIPKSHEEIMVEGLNQQQLLGDGAYDYVYASTPVRGHWRPLQGAKPYLGSVDMISSEPEVKLEFRILKARKREAEDLIRRLHPYEVPVINFIPLD